MLRPACKTLVDLNRVHLSLRVVAFENLPFACSDAFCMHWHRVHALRCNEMVCADSHKLKLFVQEWRARTSCKTLQNCFYEALFECISNTSSKLHSAQGPEYGG